MLVAFTMKYSKTPDNVRNKELNASDYFLFAVVSVGQLGTEIFTSILSARIAIVSMVVIDMLLLLYFVDNLIFIF